MMDATTMNESQQQSPFLLEGPNVMQQALQTFQTDSIDNNNNNNNAASTSTALKQMMMQQQMQLFQPTLAAATTTTTTNPAISFPFLTGTAASTTQLAPSPELQQQQIQWHQALQTLAVVQQQQQTLPAPFGVGITPSTTNTTITADSSAAVAAGLPYVASLTVPHLMQFNQMQQQQQQQQQQQLQQLALGTPLHIPIQPAPSSLQQQLVPIQSSGANRNNNINVSKITATKRRYNDNVNGTTTTTTTTTATTTKSQKRGLAKSNKKSDNHTSFSVVSTSGGSSSNNTGSSTASNSTTTKKHHPRTTSAQQRQQPMNQSNFQFHHPNIDCSIGNHIDGMDNIQPPLEKSAAVLEKMSASERRRYDRNLREQQRSYRISQQIKELRDVLQQSNVPFRPNKYSILVSVAEYIQQLQGRAIMLDSEHERLINTIRSTTEATIATQNNNNGNGGSHGSSLTSTYGDGAMMDDIFGNKMDESSATSSSDGLLFVPGIDYEAAFVHCPYPLGVATLDGRIIAANREIETLLNPNYAMDEKIDDLFDSNDSVRTPPTSNTMIDQSFFVFIRNHQEIFEAMAALLKQSTATIEQGEGVITNTPNLLFWHGQVVSSRNEVYPFTITLTNTENNNPKYFNLSAVRGA